MANLSSARNHFPLRNRPRRCRVSIFTPCFAPIIYRLVFAEIVQLRELLQTRITQDAPPLETFPETYTPLIAKLVHERSALIYCNLSGLPIH